jgi:hypothetical protein
MRRSRFAGLGTLLFGLITLVRMLGNPRLSALHALDIVSLVAAGWGLGAGFLLLFEKESQGGAFVVGLVLILVVIAGVIVYGVRF